MASTAVIVGNETFGLSEVHREPCDCIVRIPMRGSATSLNVASALSIMLREVEAQLRARKG